MNDGINDDFSSDSGSSWNEDRLLENEEEILHHLLWINLNFIWVKMKVLLI